MSDEEKAGLVMNEPETTEQPKKPEPQGVFIKQEKTDKPYWYVRRIYKFEWRNSYKPSHEDIVKVEINKDKIAEALPGLKFDAGAEAQKNGVITFSYDNGVWAAYRPNELHEWYCFKADYSEKE